MRPYPFSFFGKAPPFVPTTISGCVLWLKSDLGITTSSGNVTQWNDQSGAAITPSFTAAGAARPTYTASGGPNNVPYLTGTVNTLLSSGTSLFSSAGARTIFAVGRGVNDGFGHALLGTVFTNRSTTAVYTVQVLGDGGGGHRYLYSDGVSVNITDNALADAPFFSDFVFDFSSTGTGSALSAFFNGGSVLPTAGGNVAAESGSAGTGIMGRGDSGLQGWIGRMYEIVIYNRVLSGTEKSTVRSGLAARYGITVT